MTIEAHWCGHVGFWVLKKDGEIVEDIDDGIVYLDKAPDCTRYAKNHFGTGISGWHKPGTEAKPPQPAQGELAL